MITIVKVVIIIIIIIIIEIHRFSFDDISKDLENEPYI